MSFKFIILSYKNIGTHKFKETNKQLIQSILICSNMIKRCEAAGVAIYADIVINHMCGVGGTG